MDLPSGVFFIAVPLAVFAVFFAAGPRPRKSRPALFLFPAVLLLNAFRSIKLHDPACSFLTAGMALAGTGWAAWSWLASRPRRWTRASARNLLAAAGFAAFGGLDAVLLLVLIPWSFRGDLPGRLNSYPFGPALRSVVYANLAGCERPGSGARSFRGLRLEGADMRKAILKGADLRGARLFRACLDLADLEGADLRDAHMAEARLSFVNLRQADLSGADLSGVYSMGADLREAVLRGTVDHVQRFCNADARGADFGSARLTSAQFFGADLRGASFRSADLADAILVRARLDDADLTGASLPRADLHQAVLRGAVLGNADLAVTLRLVPDALAEVATLRDAKLDPKLSEELKKRVPGLF